MRLHWMCPLTLAGCLAGMVLGQSAEAQLVNGSFETGAYVFDGNGADSLPSGSGVITGWTTISNELAVINNANNFGITAQNGTFSLDLTGYHDGAPYGGIQQAVNTVSGQNYTLSFFLGAVGNASSVSVDTGVGAPQTFTNPGTGAFWVVQTESFTASGPTLLKFTGTTASNGNYIGLDNITLTGSFVAATPEPGSLALLGTSGISLAGLLASRRRRAKKPSA